MDVVLLIHSHLDLRTGQGFAQIQQRRLQFTSCGPRIMDITSHLPRHDTTRAHVEQKPSVYVRRHSTKRMRKSIASSVKSEHDPSKQPPCRRSHVGQRRSRCARERRWSQRRTCAGAEGGADVTRPVAHSRTGQSSARYRGPEGDPGCHECRQ